MTNSTAESTILLIEDNESHAILTRRCLNEFPAKLNVVHLTDGEEAMDYLLQRGQFADSARAPRPELVLLDLRLPRISGLDILVRMKQSEDLRAIPVVIFTSSLAHQDIRHAYLHHANSYLVKRLDFGEFRRELLDMANYWLKWNHPYGT